MLGLCHRLINAGVALLLGLIHNRLLVRPDNGATALRDQNATNIVGYDLERSDIATTADGAEVEVVARAVGLHLLDIHLAKQRVVILRASCW